MKITIENDIVTVIHEDGKVEEHPIGTPKAFETLSKVWLRSGWDTKYVYTFSWMGRPVIQLPEDMMRAQEVIYQVQPDVIVETGVAHGGSLIFYASLFRSMGKGRVVGIDIEIRPHNRQAIEEHECAPLITLLEGSSTAPEIVQQAHDLVQPGETVLVMLDSNHTREHVLAELRAYSDLVTPGSYIVAADGIMGDLVGAPRSGEDWTTNNPRQAALDFLAENDQFVCEQPAWPFDESEGLQENITYWPGAWLKRR